jgi:Uma2 family endonuclease
MTGERTLLPVKKPAPYIERMATPDLLTADDLLALNIQNRRTELVRGRLIVREPAGFRHGVVAMNLAALVAGFVKTHALGVVVAAETGFILSSDPDTVRAPDVGFIQAARVPSPLPRGYAEIAPDLAVEVLSPGDRAGDVLAKVSDWLSAGCLLVWVIDPERRLARVYRADGSESMVSVGAVLDGEDVLPGFLCPVEDLVELN